MIDSYKMIIDYWHGFHKRIFSLQESIILSDDIITDEPLFFPIFLPFCTHLEKYFVLNCLLLVHFHLLDFIGPVIRILINLDLFGLIIVS